jgi:hypothetical protein
MEIENTKGHKIWLRKKLREYGIDKDYLLGLAIIVERTVYDEQRKTNPLAHRPFYLLHKEGRRTRAWLYMAELALFCKYREYKPGEFVRSVCSLPEVKRRLYDKHALPVSFISPSTRIDASRLRKREYNYLTTQATDQIYEDSQRH